MTDNAQSGHSKKKDMIEALKLTLWVVTSAALKANVWRTTHYEWLEEDPEYAKEVSSISDMALDFAESQLHKQIKNDDTTATIFYLKCRWKKRGYIERSELEHSGRLEIVEVII